MPVRESMARYMLGTNSRSYDPVQAGFMDMSGGSNSSRYNATGRDLADSWTGDWRDFPRTQVNSSPPYYALHTSGKQGRSRTGNPGDTSFSRPDTPSQSTFSSASKNAYSLGPNRGRVQLPSDRGSGPFRSAPTFKHRERRLRRTLACIGNRIRVTAPVDPAAEKIWALLRTSTWLSSPVPSAQGFTHERIRWDTRGGGGTSREGERLRPRATANRDSQRTGGDSKPVPPAPSPRRLNTHAGRGGAN